MTGWVSPLADGVRQQGHNQTKNSRGFCPIGQAPRSPSAILSRLWGIFPVECPSYKSSTSPPPIFCGQFCFLYDSHSILPSGHRPFLYNYHNMPSPPPAWVQALKPAGPQGSELLAQERAQSNVDVDKLAELLHTKKALDRQQQILSILESDKVFDKSENYTLGRTEKIQRALAKAKRLQQLAVQHKWSQDDYYMANELLSEPTPYGLHASMFLVSYTATLPTDSSRVRPLTDNQLGHFTGTDYP